MKKDSSVGRTVMVAGTSMAGVITVFTVGGILLDSALKTSPWLTISGVILGSVAGLGIIIKALMSL